MRYLLLLLALSASAQTREQWKAIALEYKKALNESQNQTERAIAQAEQLVKLAQELQEEHRKTQQMLFACRVEIEKRKGGHR